MSPSQKEVREVMSALEEEGKLWFRKRPTDDDPQFDLVLCSDQGCEGQKHNKTCAIFKAQQLFESYHRPSSFASIQRKPSTATLGCCELHPSGRECVYFGYMCRNRKKEPSMPTEAVIKLTNARIQEVIGHFYRARAIIVRGKEGGKGNLVTYAEVLAAFQKAIDLEQTRMNHEGIIKQLETLLENAQTELTDLRAMVGRVESAAGLSVDRG